jgi:large subunit ribosomal protein L6
MSRIGKKPVDVPNGVTVTIDGQTVKAKGPKGELQTQLVDLVDVKLEDNQVVVARLTSPSRHAPPGACRAR